MSRIIRPIAALAISVLVLFFFVRPLYAELRIVQAESAQYGNVLDKATEFNRLLTSLYSEQESFPALDRERLDMWVPTKIDEVRALVDLEYLAAQHGMTFRDITAELEATEVEGEGVASQGNNRRTSESKGLFSGRLESQDISFTVLGTYEQLRDFLYDVERSVVLMEVVGIVFGDGGGELNNYQVTVRLYRLAPVTVE